MVGLDPWSVPSWPVANDLSAADRMAVVRTTRRGANIGHARLAPAVIDYSAAVRSDRRGLLWQLPSLMAGFAVFGLFVHFVGGHVGRRLVGGGVGVGCLRGGGHRRVGEEVHVGQRCAGGALGAAAAGTGFSRGLSG